MTAFADFGSAVATVDIDDWVMDTLAYWMETYLSWIELGRPDKTGMLQTRPLGYEIARPKNYANVIDSTEWPSSSLPAILVATAKTNGASTIDGEGKYQTPWLTAVSAIVRGQNPTMTRALASYTELACRMILVQHGMLGGYARNTRWLTGGQARPMSDPTGKGRYLGEGASTFLVTTDGTVQSGTGPLIPSAPGSPVPSEPPPSEFEPLPTIGQINFGLDGDSFTITGDEDQ
jgi:hypothetical protein